MECRVGCGACCIALSISSPIPGMPEGKPAGVRCVQLTSDNCCKLFGQPDRPPVCVGLRPSQEMCGDNAEEAYAYLAALEQLTQPFPIAAQHQSSCPGDWIRVEYAPNGEGRDRLDVQWTTETKASDETAEG